ncbi:MAG: hypothetical protein R3344_03855 [Acidobacteriota bacterium]|nr:hypothetical protein [Acidobacteriota bacterium]
MSSQAPSDLVRASNGILPDDIVFTPEGLHRLVDDQLIRVAGVFSGYHARRRGRLVLFLGIVCRNGKKISTYLPSDWLIGDGRRALAVLVEVGLEVTDDPLAWETLRRALVLLPSDDDVQHDVEAASA